MREANGEGTLAKLSLPASLSHLNGTVATAQPMVAFWECQPALTDRLIFQAKSDIHICLWNLLTFNVDIKLEIIESIKYCRLKKKKKSS